MEPLFVDIGNSSIRAARLEKGEWQLMFNQPTEKEELFFDWLDERMEGERVLVCSVVESTTRNLQGRYSSDRVRVVNRREIPVELIDYEGWDTLGSDRFFSCYGAVEAAGESVVVIDTGTACTVDCMTADRVYRGGVIMPGHRLIREAVSRIPSLSVPDDQLPEAWPGKTTHDSLRWGTTGLFLEAIRSFLHRHRESFGKIRVFVTGGGSPLIVRHLGEEFSIREEPFLLFQGMRAFEANFLRQSW